MPRLTANAIAPAAPWTNRAAISIGWLTAKPQTSDATREQDQARQEDPLAADQVAEPSGQQQQPAERDQVPVHHPGQAGRGEPQVPLDRRQRHGHDGAVQDDHHVAAHSTVSASQRERSI